jgi:hypothetical protein
MKDLKPDVQLKVTTAYNESTRSLSGTVKGTALNSLTGNYKMVLYLVEDNLPDWQKDYSRPAGQQDVSNFPHQHVLRDNINGIWGENFIEGALAKNDSISKNFSYMLNTAWKANDCSVVAYIYDTNTYEVIQAEEVYIIP